MTIHARRLLCLVLTVLMVFGLPFTAMAAEMENAETTAPMETESVTEPTETEVTQPTETTEETIPEAQPETEPPVNGILSTSPAMMNATDEYGVMAAASTQGSIMLFDFADNGDYVLPGKYTVEEIIPDGSLYYCKSENPQTVTITQGETAEVTFTNALRPGKITLNKVDTQGKPLTGATFLLEWSEEGSLWWPVEYSEAVEKGCCTNTDIADGCLTSGKDGIIEWEGLYPTLYYRVTEVKAPDGYNLLEGTAYEGQLPTEDLKVSFTVVNARTFTLPETGACSGMILRIASLLAAIGCIGAIVTVYRKKRW